MKRQDLQLSKEIVESLKQENEQLRLDKVSMAKELSTMKEVIDFLLMGGGM